MWQMGTIRSNYGPHEIMGDGFFLHLEADLGFTNNFADLVFSEESSIRIKDVLGLRNCGGIVEPASVPPFDQREGYKRPSAWSVSRLKRASDLIGSLAAILISSPMLVLGAVLVRCESPGPVIFRQERVGRHGMLFTVYKFRTMIAAAQQKGPCMTRSGDPRVTRVGSFMRKYKFDELPQLFNVLRGEMSLVGPRPRLPHHTAVVDMPVRPGLTGAATLVFRHEEQLLQSIRDQDLETFNRQALIPLKTKLDSDYMNQASPASDLALLLDTALSCLTLPLPAS